MTTALKIVPLTDIEKDIERIKELQHKIKVLEAEEKRIKELLIQGYFATNDTFIGQEGIVLATYKTYKAQQFLGSELKKDQPDLYATYSVEVERKRFEVKK